MRLVDWSSDVCSSYLFAVSVVSRKSKLLITLSTRPRSAHGTSLCPSNTGAFLSAASATASGDFCATAGVEARAKAARPARRCDWVMAGDRTSVVEGKRVSAREHVGGRGIEKKK